MDAAIANDPAGLLTEEAVREARQLAAVIDAKPDVKAAWVLGMFHWLRYISLDDGEDLEDYIAAVRLLAPVYDEDPDAVPPQLHKRYELIRGRDGPQPPDPIELNSRARNLLSRYQRDGELPLLTEAVALFRAALAAEQAEAAEEGEDAEDGEESRLAWRKSSLGAGLRMLFNRAGDPDLLAEAVSLHREAVAAAADDERAGCLSNLAAALADQYLLTGDPALIDEAVELLEAAADAIADEAERRTIRSNLAAARTRLAEADVTGEDLAGAVEFHRQMLAASPRDDPDRPRYLTNLGVALQALAERTADRGLLAEAVEVQRAAADACQARHPDRPGYLSNLAACLTRLSEATGDAAQLQEAVDVLRGVLADVAGGDVSRPAYLSNFASAALRLGERIGDTRLMAEAVEAHRLAVDLVPDGHQEQASHLSNLGLALQAMFERTGDTGLLAEAVSTQRAAVAAGQATPGRAGALSNLGVVLRTMADTVGDTGLLAESVQASQAAIAAAPPGHPELAGYLSNLGAALQSLAERTGRADLLAEAIQALRTAAVISPPGHPDRAGCLSNLGLSLDALFEHTGRVAVLHEAAQTHRDAVAAAPPGHPELAGYLSNLGIALQALSGRTGNEDLLAEAVTAFRDAAAATSPDDPQRATYLVNLGNALQVQHDAPAGTGSVADPGLLTEAARHYAEAAGNAGMRALDRIYALRQVSRLAVRRGAGDDALTAAEAAVALLPQVTPRSLARRDRERQLGRLAGLAGDAAAAAISAGRPDRAVELLEQTRGLLVAETLQARGSDLAKLRDTESGAELAAEYEELLRRMDALDWAGSPTLREGNAADSPADLYQAGTWQAAEALTQIRRQAHQEWVELIDRTRNSGFPDFLQPPAVAELARHADEGPVVFVFTSPTCSGALVLTAASPQVRLIPLPGLTDANAYERANQLWDARRRATTGESLLERRTGAQEIQDVLAWLWDAIAGPILAALGHTAVPATDESWPRLWWCPVGILCYLPPHAAGHHADIRADHPAPRTVLDRVVSSYIPTVRSLVYARTHRRPAEASTTLIVAAPEAPGMVPQPGVSAEADELTVMIPGASPLPGPTRGRVLEALPQHAIAHFACHGYADMIDPGASELVMPDRHDNPLTVRDISTLQLTARLAYLSACDTQFAPQNLADEAVHITGAFHLAGYQHVIGTLWSINDAAAREFAVDVYARLTRDWATPPDERLAARSLHHAMRAMRSQYQAMPWFWMTYTHTGP
jgi:tetratricopeptide (TPR) repeat protein